MGVCLRSGSVMRGGGGGGGDEQDLEREKMLGERGRGIEGKLCE